MGSGPCQAGEGVSYTSAIFSPATGTPSSVLVVGQAMVCVFELDREKERSSVCQGSGQPKTPSPA